MDLIQLNEYIRPIKMAHMKNSMKYRKLVKKILPAVDLPEVIYKIIFNYIGSSRFPMALFGSGSIHPRFVPKNIQIFHPRALEEINSQGREYQMESLESHTKEPEQ